MAFDVQVHLMRSSALNHLQQAEPFEGQAQLHRPFIRNISFEIMLHFVPRSESFRSVAGAFDAAGSKALLGAYVGAELKLAH